MAIRKTTKEAVAEFVSVHGSKYDYAQVEYVNASVKVTITCAKHGDFQQQPRAHIAGQGCPKCTQSPNWVSGPRTLEGFIARAKSVHGDAYDYSQTVYAGCMKRVDIVCKSHGRFSQLANSHLNGRGCPACAGNSKKTLNEFLSQATQVHGDRYDYSKAVYVNAWAPVSIVCKAHGEFTQSPISHLSGNGCTQCGIDAMRLGLRLTESEFIDRAKSVHGDAYDYAATKYVDRNRRVSITCPTHGEFKQRPGDHINGKHGCPKCAGNELKTTELFVQEAKSRWGELYDYSKTEYVNGKSKVTVTCRKHGDFEITAGYHLSDGGCPRCSLSSGQHDLLEYVKSLVPGEDVRSNDRVAIGPYELDVFLPGRMLAIEYNGDFYHSYRSPETTEQRRKHLRKDELAAGAGIRLIQFFEHEWKSNRPLVESVIRHQLKLSHRVWARRTVVCRPDVKSYREFMAANHFQGYKHADAVYGLELDGEMVSCASFSRKPDGSWEVERLATKAGVAVIGGAGKLFAAFLAEHRPATVHTFADARLSRGGVYAALGFSYAGRTSPNYYYLNGGSRVKSRVSCQKHKLPKLLGESFDPSLTEAENMFKAGYRRMWDAGSHRLVWRGNG